MEMMARWGNDAIIGRLSMLTGRLADGLRNLKVTLLPQEFRAPHVLSIGFPNGMPDGLPQKLAAQRVYAAARLGRMRLSPHVYNDEEDVDRFVDTFRGALNA
jgi:selenocysteine lyase/cysteine desulfurase